MLKSKKVSFTVDFPWRLQFTLAFSWTDCIQTIPPDEVVYYPRLPAPSNLIINIAKSFVFSLPGILAVHAMNSCSRRKFVGNSLYVLRIEWNDFFREIVHWNSEAMGEIVNCIQRKGNDQGMKFSEKCLRRSGLLFREAEGALSKLRKESWRV